MHNHLAMNICEAIMPIKDGTDSGKVYNNVEIDDFDTKGAYFSSDKCASYICYDEIVEINVKNILE